MTDSRYDIKVKQLLESNETMGLVLYLVLSRKYGEDWIGWEPLTVYLELREDFSCEPSTTTMDRINAIQLLVAGDTFYTDLFGFTGVCNTLAEGSPSFSVVNPVTVAEAAWAITEAGLIRDPLQYSPTIRSYIKVMLSIEGLEHNPPEILEDIVTPSPEPENSAAEYADGILYAENKDSVDVFVDDQLSLVVGQLAGLGMDDEFTGLLREAGESL